MSETFKIVSRNYRDISFSFQPHPETGALASKKDIEAVKQSVRNLIFLNKGDKPFHPEIGTDIQKLLFENSSILVLGLIEEDCRRVIQNYEPRANLISVSAKYGDDLHTV
jgi:phage baseplate assembly protein W